MECLSKNTTNTSSPLSYFTLAFLDNHANFKKSGVPSRILFFESVTPKNSKWVDFPPETVEIFKDGFVSRKDVLSMFVFGRSCIIDFVRMIVVDPKIGCVCSIAWIDVNNKCFFPKRAVGCACWRKPCHPMVSQSAGQVRFVDEIPDLNL